VYTVLLTLICRVCFCRDFGYVSRDPTTRKHRCHIFRCSQPSRSVAHVLLEAHQRQRKTVRTERGVSTPNKEVLTTPTGGPGHHGGHERYERFQCVYVGSCAVVRGQGMEVLNEAMERLSLDRKQWQDVSVDVATSNVTITDKVGMGVAVWVASCNAVS
jgi:amyloid beta (A4) precursor protein-binding family B protein 2 (Fe65-like)